jgi:guanylate kinase
MNHRGREADEAAEERLNGASAEIAAAWQYYEHMIINEDLQQAVSECVQVIKNAQTEA